MLLPALTTDDFFAAVYTVLGGRADIEPDSFLIAASSTYIYWRDRKTVHTENGQALVQPTEIPDVDDVHFRMLQPHEVGRGMAFPETYTVLGTKRDQVKQYGNAVTPPVMKMILERCVATLR